MNSALDSVTMRVEMYFTKREQVAKVSRKLGLYAELAPLQRFNKIGGSRKQNSMGNRR